MKRAVILGAGTAGTMMANKLARALPEDSWKIVVIDRDDQHVYQPGLLFLPFGMYEREDIVKRRTPLVDRRVELRLAEVERVAPDERAVHFKRGDKLTYDVLIVATGSRIQPEQTEGLTGRRQVETQSRHYRLSRRARRGLSGPHSRERREAVGD